MREPGEERPSGWQMQNELLSKQVAAPSPAKRRENKSPRVKTNTLPAQPHQHLPKGWKKKRKSQARSAEPEAKCTVTMNRDMCLRRCLKL